MAPTYTTTSLGIRWLPGSNLASDIDAGFQALAEDVDGLFAARDALLGVSSGGNVRSGKSIVASTETTTSTSYTTLTTPDRVQNVILPTDGMIVVWYQALWTANSPSAHWASLFVGANQLKIAEYDSATPLTQAAEGFVTTNGQYHALHTAPFGIVSQRGNADMTEVTTGQVIGGQSAVGIPWTQEINGSLRAAGTGAVPADTPLGGPVYIFASAGTYDISVKFKATSGQTVSVKNRHLWVRAVSF